MTSEIHANAGDKNGTLSALEEAKRLIATSSSRNRPAWFDYYDVTRLEGFEGYALLRLGRWTDAQRQLSAALKTLDPTAVKQRTVFLTDIALANVRQGDIDQACDVALEAATALTVRPYATSVQRLRALRRDLAPYASSRAVRNLDQAMAQL